MDQKVRSQDGEPVYLPTRMSRCRRKGGTYVLSEWCSCGTGSKPNRSHRERGKRPARVRRWTSGYGRSEEANAGL